MRSRLAFALALAAGTATVCAGGMSAATAAYADDTTPTPAPATASPAPAAAPAAGDEAQCDGRLPVAVQGSPGVKAHDRAGAYVWHDGTGWHLRFTHPGKNKVVVVGAIRATEPIRYTPLALEKTDKVKTSSDGKTLLFRFTNYGGIDGVDFTDACAHRTGFAMAVGGRRLPVSRIFLGADKTHPKGDPFVVVRRDSTATAGTQSAASSWS